LADRFNNLQMGLVASERVFALLDQHQEDEDRGGVPVNQWKGNISVRDLHFSYHEGNEILKGISFEIPAGEIWAVVGSTGSGKTSLINVISRAYPYQQGSVKIDGLEITEYQRSSFLSNIGVILQDVFLFSGTILENITLRNDQISIEQVQKVAEQTGINHFIERLPGGYQYEVKERGSALSAGQRQLIAFLRAMVYNPAILILDEATANIDSITEEMIQNATTEITKDRTSLIIAHRLSTIQHADQILVMENGLVVEQGNHEFLLKQQGRYYRLFQMQYQFADSIS
jgi:subfamily B ATP-binding cassette protein MsbA